MRMTFLDALLYSGMGIAVVFFALVLLMCIIKILGRFDKEAAAAPVAVAASSGPSAAPAPGTAGELKLYDTEPRVAAMLMAIVADSMDVPVNELRFISIKELKE